MQTENTLLLSLRAALPGLTQAEHRVAEVVLRSPQDAAQTTVARLAGDAGVSTASVLRLSRRLGSPRFKDFQIRLASAHAQSLAEDEHDYGEDIGVSDDLESVVRQIAQAEASSIRDTAATLEMGALVEAIAAVRSTRRVEIFGLGASGVVALDLQQKFIRIGITALAWTDSHSAWTSVATSTSDSVVIAVSHSGQTHDTVRFLELGQEHGATTIAITSRPDSVLGAAADIVLGTVARETEFRSGALGSRIAQLLVADCLFVGVARDNHEQAIDLLERTHRAVSSRRVGRRPIGQA